MSTATPHLSIKWHGVNLRVRAFWFSGIGFFFFFLADDGIRDDLVTGVQTCALPISGGGTRAAALSYGVLEELARTQIVWEGQRRRLLDEVDYISAVSGGSFTAAYYAL